MPIDKRTFGLKVTSSGMILTGHVALKRSGKVVWVGPIGMPLEDAVCDEIIVSPTDYERIKEVSRDADR